MMYLLYITYVLVSADYQERHLQNPVGLAAELTRIIGAEPVLDCLEGMHNSPVW